MTLLIFVLFLFNLANSAKVNEKNNFIIICATQQFSRINVYEKNSTVVDNGIQNRTSFSGVLFEDVSSDLLQKCQPEKKLQVEVCTSVLRDIIDVCVGRKEITFTSMSPWLLPETLATYPISKNDTITICQMTYNNQFIDIIQIRDKSKSEQKYFLFNQVTACIGQLVEGAPLQPLFPLEEGALTIGTHVSTLTRVGMPIQMNVAIQSIQKDNFGSNLLLHPCVEGVGEGYTPGLATRFFAPYVKKANSVTYGDEFFLQPDNFVDADVLRCDCPNHQEASGPFIGRPPLNNNSFSSNFVVNMVGEVYVRNASDVIVPTSLAEQNFPYESIKLVCLQHDDNALLELNSVLYQLSGPANEWAKSRITCWEIFLLEGWHMITIWYASVPMDQKHLLKLHIFDPIAIQETQSKRYVIQWTQGGRACIGSNSVGCVPAYSCCNYRSLNCSSNHHPKPSFKCKAQNFVCLAGSQAVSTRQNIPIACLTDDQKVNDGLVLQYALEFLDNEGNPIDYFSCLPASGDFNVTNTPSLTCTLYGQSLSTGESSVTINFVDTQGAVFNTVLMKIIIYGRVIADILQINEGVNNSTALEVLSQSAIQYIPEELEKNEEGQVSISFVPTVFVDSTVGTTVFQLETQDSFTVANILSLIDPSSGDLTESQSSVQLEGAWIIQMATKQGTDTCGTATTTDMEQICKNAECRFYAVDMAYCGTQGLITNTNTAVILLVCSHITEVCGDCVLVQGPQEGVVKTFVQVSNTTKAFRMVVEWEEDYRGKVIVDLQRNRNNPALLEECGLNLIEPACNQTSVGTVQPLIFARKDSVNLKAVSYQVLL